MNATKALREFAQAIRGDWSTIDGRSLRLELLGIADVIDGHRPELSIERWRVELGLCPTGQGHWTQHCDESYCGSPAL